MSEFPLALRLSEYFIGKTPDKNRIPNIKVTPGVLALELIKSGEIPQKTFSERHRAAPIDDLIVFGQGPVTDKKTHQKLSESRESEKEAGLISWGSTAARAAGELYIAGVCKRIILSGGVTGGDGPAEAHLMKKILMEEYGIPASDIKTEDQSTNTMENFVHTVNWLDEIKQAESDSHRTVGFLASDFQVGRIKMIADLIGLESSNSFSAEQVFRLIAYKTGDRNLHKLLDERLDFEGDLSQSASRLNEDLSKQDFEALFENEKELPIKEFVRRFKARVGSRSAAREKTYYEELPGAYAGQIEMQGIRSRISDDRLYALGLYGFAQYGLGDFIGLNDNRLRQFIANTAREAPELLSEIGIEPQNTIEEIRTALRPYSKKYGDKRRAPPYWWRRVLFPARAIDEQIKQVQNQGDEKYREELELLNIALKRLELKMKRDADIRDETAKVRHSNKAKNLV